MLRIDFPKEPNKYNRRRHEYWEEDIFNLPKSDKDRKPCYVCYSYPPCNKVRIKFRFNDY